MTVSERTDAEAELLSLLGISIAMNPALPPQAAATITQTIIRSVTDLVGFLPSDAIRTAIASLKE